jgi:hypothetical protein
MRQCFQEGKWVFEMIEHPETQRQAKRAPSQIEAGVEIKHLEFNRRT